ERASKSARAAASIPIDDTTAQLLDERFDVRGPRGAHELFGQRQHGSGTRTLLGKPTQCVGRDRELSILGAVLDDAVNDSVARCALVVGAAGMGKSRVRYELLNRASRRETPVTVWMARGDPIAKGSPFGMVAQLVRQAAGVLEGEPALLRQAKLA